MTATETQHGALPSVQTLAASALVCIRWKLSPRAVAATSASAALLNGHAAQLRGAALEWRLALTSSDVRGSCSLVLTLRDGTTDTLPILENVPVTVSTTPGYQHLDAPGRLAITLRASTRTLIFARTTVLQNPLGLPGGVYESPAITDA